MCGVYHTYMCVYVCVCVCVCVTMRVSSRCLPFHSLPSHTHPDLLPFLSYHTNQSTTTPQSAAEETTEPARKVFRRYFYRGIEVHKLLDLSHGDLMQLMHARARRRFARGNVPMHFIQRLRKAKKSVDPADPMSKPDIVKTHLRNMLIVPEMVAAQVGVYNGLGYSLVEIKPHMIGHYLGEFSITYKPCRHGKAGLGASMATRFIPVK
jgi:small subunit ribosomal protein S15e